MNIGKTILGALLGAVVGCAVWTGVAWLTGYELGILAIGLGFACGAGAAMGAEGRAGTLGGFIAGCTAMIAIVVSRGIIVDLSINQFISEAIAQTSHEIPAANDDEYWTAFIADQIIEREVEAGGAVDWADSDDENDSVASQYPADIWSQAQAAWNSMSPSEREQFCTAGEKLIAQRTAEGIDSFRGVAGIIGMLWANLHPISLIIMGLAVATAFQTARNSRPASGTVGEMTEAAMTHTCETTGSIGSSPLPGMPASPLNAQAPNDPPPVHRQAMPSADSNSIATAQNSETWLPPWMRK